MAGVTEFLIHLVGNEKTNASNYGGIEVEIIFAIDTEQTRTNGHNDYGRHFFMFLKSPTKVA